MLQRRRVAAAGKAVTRIDARAARLRRKYPPLPRINNWSEAGWGRSGSKLCGVATQEVARAIQHRRERSDGEVHEGRFDAGMGVGGRDAFGQLDGRR